MGTLNIPKKETSDLKKVLFVRLPVRIKDWISNKAIELGYTKESEFIEALMETLINSEGGTMPKKTMSATTKKTTKKTYTKKK